MCAFPPSRLPGLLVVHDDTRVLSGLCALLKLEGFAAFQATNAHAALAALRGRAGEIDVAVIDVDTPGGAEAFQLLRAESPKVRCWLLRGQADNGGLPAEGFEGVLAKPFTLAALRTCLASMRQAGVVNVPG